MERKQITEKDHKRHLRFWAFAMFVLKPFISLKFKLEAKKFYVDGPCIVVPNHVSNWDPLLVAMSFPKKQMYFVASEHLYRLGFASKLLAYFLAPTLFTPMS